MKNTYVYIHKNSIYINLTNQCTNNCDFCIRHDADGIDGYDLWLKKEPTAKNVIAQLKKLDVDSYDEVVFCGFGEPTMKLDEIIDISGYLKTNYANKKIRINTNGQANLFHRQDVTPKFEGLIDVMSISLNAPSALQYDEICHSDFSVNAFDGLLDFAIKAKKHVRDVRFSIVDIIGDEKIAQCQKIADKLDVVLHIRKMIE